MSVTVLHFPSKKKQGKHIKRQMHIIGMNQPAGNKAVILPAIRDRRRPENKVINNPGIAEAADRNQAGNDNDAYSKAEHLHFFLKIGFKWKQPQA